jgi:hypothetical protein
MRSVSPSLLMKTYYHSKGTGRVMMPSPSWLRIDRVPQKAIAGTKTAGRVANMDTYTLS